MDTECREDEFWQREVARFVPDVGRALEEAMGYVCCPICQVLANLPFEYFALLPKRWPQEAALREVVCGSQGFCNAHTWRLHRMQSLVAIATIYVDVLQAVADPPSPPMDCPVCRLMALAEELLMDGFSHWLNDPGSQEHYRKLFGVCYPHLGKLLQRDLTPQVRQTLLQSQAAVRADLAANLRGFLAKNTVEAKWTRTEAENRSPRRVLLKLAGNEEA